MDVSGKNYYRILGVPQDESPAGIRSAYRGIIKTCHPDVAGPQGTSRFREVSEAYEVLSDPERKREYDSSLGLHSGGSREQSSQAYSNLLSRGRSAAEFEVLLSREEARRGTRFTIRVPLRTLCRACGGSGGTLIYPCRTCEGNGAFVSSGDFLLELPPIPIAGAVYEMALRRGEAAVLVRLHVRVR